MTTMSLTHLQAVDNALAGVFADCFAAMNPDSGPEEFQRFLQRPNSDRIFHAKNDDVQATLRKLARWQDDPGHKKPDLPVLVFYREHGISGDMDQRTQVAEITRFIHEKTLMSVDDAMKITAMPLTLTYSVLFLAWDRASIEAMALAWWGYLASRERKRNRFLVPYTIDGERFDVSATINAPREILTAFEPLDSGYRLWGSRTALEVNTQAVYGAKVRIPDFVRISGTYDKLFR